MKKRVIFFIVALIIIALLGVGIVASKRLFIPKKVHYHAGFVVFQNNKKLDFSDSKYMNLRPCVANEKDEETPDAIQEDKAHLHDNVGYIVHVEREGGTWKDLFTNLAFPIDYAKTTGYINGKQIPNFQNQLIHDADSLVAFIGNNDKKLLAQAITKTEIAKKAKESVDCGD
jgi:hypothetical protein